jgi:hypothetical protein
MPFLCRFAFKITLNGLYEFYGLYGLYFKKYNEAHRLLNFSKLTLTAFCVYSIQAAHNAGKPQESF